MEDRELLELAARAAGYKFSWCMTPLIETVGYEVDRPYTVWNPIDDDGDALRLAVKLGIHLQNSETDSWATLPSVTRIVPLNNDAYSATRRAIVLAAAEIGKKMP